MSKRLFASMLWLVACGDEVDEGAAHCSTRSVAECGTHTGCQVLRDDAGTMFCGEERIGIRGCDVMSVDECKLDARCQTIDGRPFDEDRTCSDALEPKGCQFKDVSCPPAIVYGRDAAGKSYEFASGCVPAGFARFLPESLPQQSWPACSRDGQAGATLQDASVANGDASIPTCDANCQLTRCDQLDVASCKREASCQVVRAWPFDPNRKCRGEERELGCTYGGACDPRPALGYDAQGQSYIFAEGGSACVPPSYTTSSVDGLYYLCDAPATDPCAGLTYLDCDQHPECRQFLGCPVPSSQIGPGECEQRTIAGCKVDGKCASMQAQPLDAVCGYEELVGCITVDRTCHYQTAYGMNADGRVFRLDSDDCLPIGFSAVPNVPQPGVGTCPVSEAERCDALGVARCADDARCELAMGRPLDLNAHCVGAPAPFGCAAKSEVLSEGAAIVAAPGGHRHRVEAYRWMPGYSYYRPSDTFFAAATAALLSWPGCD